MTSVAIAFITDSIVADVFCYVNCDVVNHFFRLLRLPLEREPWTTRQRVELSVSLRFTSSHTCTSLRSRYCIVVDFSRADSL